MKPGRILAAAGALSLVALGAGTMMAHAANELTVQFDAPAANYEFTSPSTDLRGHYTLASGTTISDLTVTVKTPDGQTVGQQFQNPSNGTFEWVPAAWKRNGAYTATVVANGHTGGSFNSQPVSGSDVVPFYVSAPPQTPTGVSTSVDDSARSVTVSWNANPEPDLVMYVIGRYPGNSTSGGKAFFIDPSQTSLVDDLGTLPAGSYRYDVYAVRKAAKSSEQSIPSKSAGTSTANVRSAPPTTNTTSGGGGSTATTVSPSGSSTSGTSSSSGPALAQHGKVDLSGFGNLLAQSGGLPSRPAGPPATLEPDSGFGQTLPYGARPPAQSNNNDNSTALGAPDSQRLTSSKERPTSLLFLAAGLLATVLLMHLLWVKSEVDRAPLDPLPAPMPRPQPRTRREPRLP